MKKKICVRVLTISILTVIPLMITGCSGTENYGTITDGKKESKVTSKELIEISDSNNVRFKKNYSGKEIEITDTVKSIEDDGEVTCLYLTNGWVFAYDKHSGDFIDFVSDLDKGDSVTLTGEIYAASIEDEYCGNTDVNDIDYVEINITSSSIMEKAN